MFKYVQLSNGDMFRIFKDADGSMYYVSKRKVRKDQKVIDVSGDVVPGASGEFTFATDAELFRVPSNSFRIFEMQTKEWINTQAFLKKKLRTLDLKICQNLKLFKTMSVLKKKELFK